MEIWKFVTWVQCSVFGEVFICPTKEGFKVIIFVLVVLLLKDLGTPNLAEEY